jgi:hypothetical protein
MTTEITHYLDIISADNVTGSGDPPADLEAFCDRATDYCTEHEPDDIAIEFRPVRGQEIAQLCIIGADGVPYAVRRVDPDPQQDEVDQLVDAAIAHAWATEPGSDDEGTDPPENLAEIITRRLIAGDTPESIARDLSLDLEDSAILLPGWYAADESGCDVHFVDASDAAEAASAYVDGGDWPEVESTVWHSITCWRAGLVFDGEDVEVDRYCVTRETIAAHPDEPACTADDGHEWKSPHSVVGGLKENPGCWGHGGGVKTAEVCLSCGTLRHTDTWATNPCDGTQGHTSIEYEKGDLDELLGRFDVGDMEQTDIAAGDGWQVFIAEHPAGPFGVVSCDGDGGDVEVEWFATEAEAREEAAGVVDNFRAGDEAAA